MSPIIDVQQRMMEVGRLRFGMKNERNLPVKLKTWRMTSQDRTRLEAAAELWGGEVRPWEGHDGQWELFTETSELRIMLLPGQALSQYYELWGQRAKSKPVECLRRCDGRHELFSDGPCLCPRSENGRLEDEEEEEDICKPMTRLSVMLPELVGLGHWRVESGGWSAMQELAGITGILEKITSAGQIVPARLRLTERRAVKGGQTHKFVVPVIDVDVTIPQLMGGTPLQLTAGGENGHGHTPIPPPRTEPVTLAEGIQAVSEQTEPKARSARSAASLGPPAPEALTLLQEPAPASEPPASPPPTPTSEGGEQPAVAAPAGSEEAGGAAQLVADPAPSPVSERPASPGELAGEATTINDRQRRMLFGVARDSGLDEDMLREVITELTGQSSTRAIKVAEFEALLSVIRAKEVQQ